MIHKRLGRVYAVLIRIAAVVTLSMPAVVEPRVPNHFGFIHLSSVLLRTST